MLETKDFKIRTTTEMLGTVAKDPEIFRTYIESKKPPEIDEDESENIEKTELKGWTGFHKDDEGIFLYDYVVKGFIKNAGNVLKEVVKVKALRSKIDDFVFVFPRKIRLAKEPDGVNERPIRIITAMGTRVALIRSDYLKEGVIIEFKIGLLPHKEINWVLIDKLLEYGQFMGLGQFRNGGYGRFEVLKD